MARHPDQRSDRGVDVSILVPVYNEERFIRETTAAMQAQKFAGRLEFLFVDGGSTDQTRRILEELATSDPRIRVLDNPHRRTPHALNIGLREARGEFVARMDAHSWYPPEYIARGVQRLRRGDVEWVTGPAVPRGVGPWGRRVALALESPLGQGGSGKWASGSASDESGAPTEETELDTGVFAGVWRRSTLDHFGGWDEGWPVNQDAELAARVLSTGGRIVCVRDMGAVYAPRESLPALAKQYWRFGYYRVKTTRRHPDALRRSHVVAIALPWILLSGLVCHGRIGRLARGAGGAYLASLVAFSLPMARTSGRADAASMPLVFMTMHLAWGAGFAAGCVRLGVPLHAFRRVLPRL